jgi:hypothetical protein
MWRVGRSHDVSSSVPARTRATPSLGGCDGKRAIVHHDASGEQRVGRNFALAGLVGAESRDVSSGSQMPAKQERLLSPGRRHTDVSAVEGFIEIAGQSDFRRDCRQDAGPLLERDQTRERPSKGVRDARPRVALAFARSRR